MIHQYNKYDLKKRIEYLERRVDLTTYNPYYLRNYLSECFPYIPVGIIDIKKGTRLFRGRKQEQQHSYKKVTDFSYVPHKEKEKCKEFGRANLPHQSLFYSSNNIDTAQMECISKDINKKIWMLAFGEWEVQENLILADIILHDIEELKLSSISKKREIVHSLIKQELNEEQFECQKMILDFFGKQFSKTNIPTDRHYLYSVYLAERLMRDTYDGEKIDGIKYPSIPMRYQGDNIVLIPDIIDSNKIKLIQTFEMVCAVSAGKLYSKIENKSTKVENGEVFWQKEGVMFY